MVITCLHWGYLLSNWGWHWSAVAATQFDSKPLLQDDHAALLWPPTGTNRSHRVGQALRASPWWWEGPMTKHHHSSWWSWAPDLLLHDLGLQSRVSPSTKWSYDGQAGWGPCGEELSWAWAAMACRLRCPEERCSLRESQCGITAPKASCVALCFERAPACSVLCFQLCTRQ